MFKRCWELLVLVEWRVQGMGEAIDFGQKTNIYNWTSWKTHESTQNDALESLVRNSIIYNYLFTEVEHTP